MLCSKCGHDSGFLVCPCYKLEYLYTGKDGKKYYKKTCRKCNKLIYSKGATGLAPFDYLYETCNLCYRPPKE